MFNMAVNGVLLGVGKTKVSLVLLVAINILNVAINYIFIFGLGPVPAYGVLGAAFGTVLARTLGAVAGLWVAVSRRFPVRASLRHARVFDIPLLRKVLFLGGPRSLQGIVRNFSRLMIIRIATLLPHSTRVVSAYSVGMQVRMISSFVGLAFMGAAMARVGQNMGAGKAARAERSGWISAAMAAGLMSFVAALFLIFPQNIMSFFTTDTEVIDMGKTFFMVIAVTEPIMAFAFALGGSLRGGGDPLSPFIYGSVSDLVVVICLGYVLAVRMGMGLTGIAVAIAASAVTRALPTVWKFRKGEWKSSRV
jgi:putative MATE family efflux protein